MSWLWWKSPSDELSSSSSSSSAETQTRIQTQTQSQHTNSAPASTSTSTSTNDPATPVPDASTTTIITTTPSTTPSTPPTTTPNPNPNPSPYQPLDPLTESSLPTTLPCTPLFDSAFFCSSLGGHLTSIYRTGSIADCRDNWSRFWFCMRTRAIWDPDEKREVIREYNRGNWRESYYGGRNWVLRDGEYRDRTGGMNPTVVTASSMTAARTAGTGSSGSSKYAYATDDDNNNNNNNNDDIDGSAPEGSKEKKENGWRSLFRARSRNVSSANNNGGGGGGGGSSNSDTAADSLAAGGGSGRYRSSEDIWELRTEPVARAFDLHPLRDLGEVLIDEQGYKYRVKDLEEKAGGHEE